MKSLNGVAVVAAWSALAVGGTAFAQEAVQWRVEDGGNGHWYGWTPTPLPWTQAAEAATQAGGHLAVLLTAEEDAWANQLVHDNALFVPNQWGDAVWGPWIGLFQDRSAKDYSEPSGGWYWVTGEPLDFHSWNLGAPNNYPGCSPDEDFVHMHMVLSGPVGAGWWNDLWSEPPCNWACIGLIEWSADCNGDGIVDYGQILDGTLDDTNGNGVPDCCDEPVSCDPCVGDVNFDGIVNGADISVLLGFWGLNGKPVAADINKDGSVDGADLAQLLGSWGECP
jgi:hypothetical protein